MHEIELKIYKFLEDLKYKSYTIPQDLLDKFGKETQFALKRQFERESREFRLSMSNVGRPLCQLQMERDKGSKSSGIDIPKFLFGDLVEAQMYFLIKASGLDVVSEQKYVKLNIGGIDIGGNLDIIIKINGQSKVYDIKSVSEYSFKDKLNNSYQHFIDNDAFGYNAQLFCYAEAEGLSAGGFILGNKSSGEIGVLEVPHEQDKYRKQALETASNNLHNIGQPFKKSFKDVPEYFNRKETGNRVLGRACGFCNYKHECWPNLRIERQAMSKAKSPKMVFYTEYSGEAL